MVNTEALFARVAALDKRQEEQNQELASAHKTIAKLQSHVAYLEKEVGFRKNSLSSGPADTEAADNLAKKGTDELALSRRRSRDESLGNPASCKKRFKSSTPQLSGLENGSPASDQHDSDAPTEGLIPGIDGHSLGEHRSDIGGLRKVLRGPEASEAGRRRIGAEQNIADIYGQAVSLRDGTHGGDPCPLEAVVLLKKTAARGHVDSMMALADLYFSGKVAKAGSLRQHQRAALLWWEKVLVEDPKHVDAMCKKGEALFQISGSTCSELLQSSYDLFDKAASLGSKLANFLKGRWLVLMAPSHCDAKRALQGRKLVEQAAHLHGLARAYVFLGHCYEFPQDYTPAVFDAPDDKKARENLILSMYQKAAELGDPDGLNDIGSCHATGYGSIKKSFDLAVQYYSRAIKAGSLDAYDNLGTHYETGMNGAAPDRIDVEKALHYYRLGAARRCPKCALNLGTAYEEGMETKSGTSVLKRDPGKAEKYFMHAIGLGNDRNDVQTVERARKDLAALLLTRLKLAPNGSSAARVARERLYLIMEDSVFHLTLRDVDTAIVSAVSDRTKPLELMLGEHNAKAIIQRCRGLLDQTHGTSCKGQSNGDEDDGRRQKRTSKVANGQQQGGADSGELWANVRAMFGSALPKLPKGILGSEPEQEGDGKDGPSSRIRRVRT